MNSLKSITGVIAVIALTNATLLFANNDVIGYAAEVTGGKNGVNCYVENTDDSGPGTLRACINSEGVMPTNIVFNVDGTITTENYLYLNNNLTIDASGRDITITGENGFGCFGNSNIIIRNIKLVDIGSGIRMRDGCNLLWLDHVSISGAEDESIAIDQGSTNITVSWSKVENADKAVLIGSSFEDEATKNTSVTLHHNYLAAEQRNPNVRYAKVHAFNNLIKGYVYEGMVASQEGKIIAQGNIIEAQANSPRKRHGLLAKNHNVGDTTHGYIWSTGNLFLNKAKVSGKGISQEQSLPESWFRSFKDAVMHPWFFNEIPEPFTIPYKYDLDEANETLIQSIENDAGATR